jgi:hypothetical protein
MSAPVGGRGPAVEDTARPGLGIWLATVALAVAALVGSAWLLDYAEVAAEVNTIIVFVLGLIVLFTVIGLFVVGFHSRGLTSSRQALALPEGSIRALLALILVLAFIFTAVYLVERVYLGQQPGSPAAQDVALQLISILGTLVTAAAAFYFGANAVKSGAAVTAAVMGPTERAPTATTKGNEPPEGGNVTLVGFVNPRGRDTQWLFEYGETSEYGSSTPPKTVSAGEKDVQVKEVVPHTGDIHMRIVAFNEGGVAYGDDHTVPPPTEASESTETIQESAELAALEEEEAAPGPLVDPASADDDLGPPPGAEKESAEPEDGGDLSDDDLEPQSWEDELEAEDRTPSDPAAPEAEAPEDADEEGGDEQGETGERT